MKFQINLFGSVDLKNGSIHGDYIDGESDTRKIERNKFHKTIFFS